MDFDKKTERKAITIQHLTFQVISPYKEGAVLTANEAAVLNQTLAENLRNNFAGAVGKAVKEAGEGNTPDIAALQKALDAYTKEYTFGVRRSGGTIGDPVAREARSIALDMAKGLLKKKGHKIAEVPKDTMDALIEQILAKKPDIAEIAKRRVAERQAVAASGLDIAV